MHAPDKLHFTYVVSYVIISVIHFQLLEIFSREVSMHLAKSSNNEVVDFADKLRKRLENVTSFIQSNDSAVIHGAARDLAFELGHVYIGMLQWL